ncbi:hypothetical protein L3C95_16400 [Chitinophaga filiformis]|uniref:hypothetical protein n=1 Tax=Chitinophaga filiformis TaxID=104663 RepID=UPI001F22AC28|nr:hypothetical protein [Chitinophaga filiformis]MCF6404479.1 hypothetical protein [Chitinophaga filiformis]
MALVTGFLKRIKPKFKVFVLICLHTATLMLSHRSLQDTIMSKSPFSFKGRIGRMEYGTGGRNAATPHLATCTVFNFRSEKKNGIS